jgi:hypothetical protein
MLQWTAAGQQGRSRPVSDGAMGARFMALVHHTDAERECAYDRTSRVGKLDKALDQANADGWLVVDMKRDWLRVFPFQDATVGAR